MNKLDTSDCKSWEEILLKIRKLDQKTLFMKYHAYLNLCAKSPRDLRLEVMLEEEITRRSVK